MPQRGGHWARAVAERSWGTTSSGRVDGIQIRTNADDAHDADCRGSNHSSILIDPCKSALSGSSAFVCLVFPKGFVMSMNSASAARRWPRLLLHVIRRVHLHCGLLLAPWVLMYAVSAFLLNHPTAFPDQEGTAFGPSDVAGTSLAEIRPAGDVAADVVGELNRRAGREQFRLVRPEKAQYRGEFASAVLRTEGKAYTVFVDIRDGTGFARLRDEPKEKAPLPAKLESARPTVLGQIRDGLPAAPVRACLPPSGGAGRPLPRVTFRGRGSETSGSPASRYPHLC